MSHLLGAGGLPVSGLLAVTQADLAEGAVPGWLRLLVTVAAFVLPFVVGALIARSLRVKEWSQRIGVVLLATTLGLMPFLYQYLASYYEQAAYERQLAAWDKRGEAFEVSDEAIEELRKRRAGLTIIDEASDRPERRGAAIDATE